MIWLTHTRGRKALATDTNWTEEEKTKELEKLTFKDLPG